VSQQYIVLAQAALAAPVQGTYRGDATARLTAEVFIEGT
jgi:hypothetical protein